MKEDPSVRLPIEAWVEVLTAMKRNMMGAANLSSWPFSNQYFMHALAKIQLVVDSETL